MKKIIIIFLVLGLFVPVLIAQNSGQDKFTTINVIIKKVISTNMGLIIQFYTHNKTRNLYLPHKFFVNGTAIRIIEDGASVNPQMNIIYKNLEPFKVKLYLAESLDSEYYGILDVLTQEQIDTFNKTDKINISFKDETDTTTTK